MQLAGGNNELATHPTVSMHAEYLQILTAIAVTFPARKAVLAIHVRLNGTAAAGLQIRPPRADRHDFDTQFVAGDARVTIERHFAEETAQVSAADADPMNPHQDFSRARVLGFGDLD